MNFILFIKLKHNEKGFFLALRCWCAGYPIDHNMPVQTICRLFFTISVQLLYFERMRLVQSLVVPLLMYCDVIYSQSSVEVTRMLNVA
jgi:hypothetical protein